jgi:hypothetical protein
MIATDVTTGEWVRSVAGRAGSLTGEEAAAFDLLARAADPVDGRGAVRWDELARVAGRPVDLGDLGPASVLRAGRAIEIELEESRDELLVYRLPVERDAEDAAAELRQRSRYWWVMRKGREHGLPFADRAVLHVLAIDADPETGRGSLDLCTLRSCTALPAGRLRQGLARMQHHGLLAHAGGEYRLRFAA